MRMSVHRNAAMRQQKPAKAPKPGPVLIMQVDPEVLKLALSYASGDARRLEIISPTHVTVRNNRVR